MNIQLVSANSLFKDVLLETLKRFKGINTLEVDPESAPSQIEAQQPKILLIDESLPADQLETILQSARALTRSRVVLLNPAENDVVVIESHTAAVRKAEDLMKAMGIDGENYIQTQNASIHQVAAAQARQRADMFAFLAGMFNSQPDLQFVNRLRYIGVEPFLQIGQQAQTDADIDQGLSEMAGFIQATTDNSEEEIQEQLAVDWTWLFRGVRTTYGPPPPYEGVFIDGGKEHISTLEAVVRDYKESGAKIDERFANRPDYVGLELEFLRFLSNLEAEAWQVGDSKGATEYSTRASRFISNHLGRWINDYCDTAIAEAKTDFYRGLVRLTKSLISSMGVPSAEAI